MRKWFGKLYMVFLAGTVALFLYMCTSLHLDITKQKMHLGYEKLTDYAEFTYEENDASAGVKKEYILTLQNVENNYDFLYFYTFHQNVAIYLEDTCIYSAASDAANRFGRTPGYLWNSAYFTPEDNGKQVRIVLTPVYSTSVDTEPTFYFGSRLDILTMVLTGGLPVLFFSFVVFLGGLAFILGGLVSMQTTEWGSGLVYLGIFSILIGLWKLTDSAVFAMLCANRPVAAYVPFMALMMMEIPFILYIKDFYHSKESMIWYILCSLSLLQTAVALALQVTGICDMRQTLFLSHFLFAMVILVVFVMSFLEVHCYGWNVRMKQSLIGMGICCIGALIDMILYYQTNENEASIVATFCLGGYIFAMGLTSMKDVRRLIKEGVNARRFEQMAFHDQLTGLYNRMAYTENVNTDSFRPENCIVMMFDLNKLKQCNDTLGHAKGDVYIKESAMIISECFGDLGACYRMGGDEFCVILKSCGIKICKERITKMRRMEASFNEKEKEIHMHIACGYAVYDKGMDYDIADTVRRADRAMYEEKFASKQPT